MPGFAGQEHGSREEEKTDKQKVERQCEERLGVEGADSKEEDVNGISGD